MSTLLIIILLIVLGYIAMPLIKGWLYMRNLRDKVNESFGGRRNDSSTNKEGDHKIYTDKDGEYAEFEDITGPVNEGPAPNCTDGSGTVVEEQVTDAEFEEVK